jgi:HD-GYP domain-containing protein (c-di-GMP phosphodiesterase class II)
MRHHYPLHIHISTVFVVLILLVSSLIAGLGFKLSRDMIEATATDVTRRISRETMGALQRAVEPAEVAVNLLSYDPLNDTLSFEARWKRLGLVRAALNNSIALSSIYVGFESGDFFLMRRVRDDDERLLFRAPEGTRYIVQSIERAGAAPRGRLIFLNTLLETLRQDERADYAASYDPRRQRWYWEAEVAASQVTTPPYLLYSDRKVGMTLAMRAQNGRAMIGADILLETLSASLAQQKVTPGSKMVLVNPQGLVVAHEGMPKPTIVPDTSSDKPGLLGMDDLGAPVLAGLGEPTQYISGSEPYVARVAMDDGTWRITISPLLLEGTQPLYLVIAVPDSELFAAAMKLRSTSLLVTVLIIALAIPITWAIARSISGTLRNLAGEAEAIRRFEFSKPIAVRSTIREVHELAVTMDTMKVTIRRFLDITRAVAAEEDFNRLLPMLLTETLSAADADAGVLYLVDHDKLLPMAASRIDGTDRKQYLSPVALNQPGPLIAAAIRDGQPRAAALAAEDIETLGLARLADFPGTPQGVAVPLSSRDHRLVGAILILRHSPIGDAQVSFVRALSGSAASSLETRELIKAQKELFHAFIQLIAAAIDAKSPYTGGHCARVPELTKMLAHAACDDACEPFKGFKLDKDEWEALYVAAWMHDCGKITIPEYVVDKATKLETIYDRIHEVRMRFEVLKRDAEIACLKAIAGGEDEAAASARLAAEQRRLDDDYAFVAACNKGSEFMAAAAVERLQSIGARTWMRTLDDRIGISREELQHKAHTPATRLPVLETLLADKPEHLFERRPQDRMPADNRWGFRMAVPELLYNKGELYNLSVSRGTLTAEERYKIDEHIVQTLIMLSQLPFPKHLRRVPELAGGHHERMDGTGYPKRLKKEDMSLVARMMAIADIFEALTAVDRPYKEGKTLSEAIRIMSAMKQNQHIDPDLFDLFLRSGVYLEYAHKFMQPEQIDTVDGVSELRVVTAA